MGTMQRVHCIKGKQNEVCDVPWPVRVLCGSWSCPGQDEPLWDSSAVQVTPHPGEGQSRGSRARWDCPGAGMAAGTNPAAPYQMLPPCLRSLHRPNQPQLVLSSPLSPRLDASQWISMSHSNAEKLMIKKEFFPLYYSPPPPPLHPGPAGLGSSAPAMGTSDAAALGDAGAPSQFTREAE